MHTLLHYLFSGLLIFLFSPFSEAQQQRFIDTQQDCAAKGGSWESHNDDWLHFCMLPAKSREECEDKGVAEYETKDQWLCRMPTSISGQKKQCTAKGGSWGKHGGMSAYCYFKAEEKACRARKGTWERAGMMGMYRCITTSKDAGKPCKGQADCEYGCKYDGPNVAIGMPVQGVCRPVTNPTGCWNWVEHGKFVGHLCTD